MGLRAPPQYWLAQLVAAIVCAGISSRAAAFRCAQSQTQLGEAPAPALSWARRDLTFTLQAEGTTQLPVADTQAILRAAFVVWQGLTLAADAATQCGDDAAATDITFTEMPPTPLRAVGYNFLDPNANINLIMFDDDGWETAPTSQDIVALTTTTYSALTGEIFDADIAFNSATFQFVTADPSDAQLDLLSVAVHEIGHFLGLAHCTDDATAGCGHSEVMEPQAAFGTVTKRQLQCDDRAAIAFRYPAGRATGACDLATTAASNEAACPSGCQPPTLPAQVAAITHRGSDMGRGCHSGPAGPEAVLVGLTGIRRARRYGRRTARKDRE